MDTGKRDLRRALAYLEQGDWKAAHEIVQEDEDSRLFCWAHGIVHLMEGDLPNARYWYRKAGRPPFSEAPSIAGEVRALKAEIGRKSGSDPDLRTPRTSLPRSRPSVNL